MCCQRRRRRLGTFQPVPTPARCRARQASPTSSRLVGANTALVAVLVAFSKNAITNSTAAIIASIRHPFRVLRVREVSGRFALRAGLWLRAGDLRVHPDIVQGTSKDGGRDGARFGAACAGPAVVVA